MAAEQPNAKRLTPPSLDDLPSSVRLHILGFLPLIDAVTASLISRKWRNLWHSMPCLKFKLTKFPLYDDDPPCRFSDFVNLALLQRPCNMPLQKFCLLSDYVGNNHRNRSLVTSWLRYALNCRVIHLKLDLGITFGDNEGNWFCTLVGDEGRYFDFHFLDLKSSSVRDFTLRASRLIVPLNSSAHFDSLQSVTLVEVFVSDEMLTDMISKCVNLERLVLCKFRGVKKFRIFSEKLKELILSLYLPVSEEDFESSVEICTPNLCSIKLDHFYVAKYTVTDLSAVVRAELEFVGRENYSLQCWKNVMGVLAGAQQLIVENMWLKLLYPVSKSTETFKLSNLKFLELKTGYSADDLVAVWSVLERSPRLETLVLDFVYQNDKDVSFYDEFKGTEVLLNVPNLREVTMQNFQKTRSEFLFMIFMLKSRVVLEKMVLVPAKLGETPPRCPTITITDFDAWGVSARISKKSEDEN